jgi:hypothetical protein
MIMDFDVVNFLETNGIEYIIKGSGVQKGNINIQCPYCGTSDTGHHLGIRLDNGFWGCWRSASHRNKKLYILISKLLGISFGEAKKIVGDNSKSLDSDIFSQLAEEDFFKKESENNGIYKSLLFSDSFRKLNDGKLASKKFIEYLSDDRGFSDPLKLAKKYKLRYCISGKFNNRIIIPVFYNKLLLTWTSRAIDNTEIRYLTLNKSEESENIKNLLYNYDRAKKIKNGKILFIVEGPIDVWKLDLFSDKKISAVGLFNMSLEIPQLYLLEKLSKQFEKIVLLLDKGEFINSIEFENAVNPFCKNLFIGEINISGIGDPGDMNEEQVKILTNQWE